MQTRLVQIDAFADRVFAGNPAAVVPLPSWLPDEVLQSVAEENNLSETAFVVADLPAAAVAAGDGASADVPRYHLRWFTPAVEVDLCGHATLATAAHLFDDVHPQADRLRFWTRSGWLSVARGEGGALVLDLPAERLRPVPDDDPLADAAVAALGVEPVERLLGTDLVLVLAGEAAVRSVVPDASRLERLPVRGVVVTAPADPGGPVDVVSRWFGGSCGVAEDPVTGSAHSQFASYWARRLGRDRFAARQLSARGGTVGCELAGDRVLLTGAYRRYLDGTITIPDPPA